MDNYLFWVFVIYVSFLYCQLGLGHTNHVREPTLITVLQGKNIRQISAGRCHSAAWTAPPVPPRAPGEEQEIVCLYYHFVLLSETLISFSWIGVQRTC